MLVHNKQKSLSEIIRLLPFFLFFVLLTWMVSYYIFFWDTIQLGAKHASFYYENGFSKLLLPDQIDSGHIPAFGMYIACCWKIFGKSLFVSHFVMLPFLLGIVWQAFLLLKNYINPRFIYFALILFLADATFLGQAVLVTPDIPLVFLFLLGLNAIHNQKKILLLIATTGLVLISLRGMMVAFALFLLDVFMNVKFTGIKPFIILLIKKSFIYLPALSLFLAYNIYHFYTKGWIGYHKDSPWGQAFEIVNGKGMIYNIGILGWRMLDFGRIFLWIAFVAVFLTHYKKLMKDKKTLRLLLIFLVVTVSLSISFVMYKSLNGHRYLLPSFLSFAMLTIYLVFEKTKSNKKRYVIFSVLLASLLSGNLWIYAPKIAQGWDSSLAHLPYYSLRDKMLTYLNHQNINIGEVACTFPNNTEQKFLELNDNLQKHCELDLDSNRYVLYSNIYNDFSDKQIDRLKTDFNLIKEFRKGGIFIRLYQKKYFEKKQE